MKINVTKTCLPERKVFDQYVDKIFVNQWLTNNGTLVQELEKKLSRCLGVENLLLVSSGTIALQIMYKTLGLTGNVITTPFSFVATTSSLVWEGLEPNFVDIHKDTLNINEEKIQENINQQTSAILGVHVFGNPCEVEALEKIAFEHNIKLVFDAAHCFGVQYKGKSLLEYGDASILSFHSTKLFHTIEGGAIIFKNEEDCKKARLMINFGISGPEKVECLGINGKMNEFQAAMGLALLDTVDDSILDRKAIAEHYDTYLKRSTIQWSEYMIKTHGYYPVIFESETLLRQAVSKLNKENIFPRRYFNPSLNTLNYIEYSPMPISEDISKRILCLPIYPGLQKKDIDLIIKILNENG